MSAFGFVFGSLITLVVFLLTLGFVNLSKEKTRNERIIKAALEAVPTVKNIEVDGKIIFQKEDNDGNFTGKIESID